VIKVKLVCDRCSAVIDDGISAIDLRVAAHDRYQEGRSAVATRPSATPFPVDIHPGPIGAY
jgi:hypothetical protein